MKKMRKTATHVFGYRGGGDMSVSVVDMFRDPEGASSSTAEPAECESLMSFIDTAELSTEDEDGSGDDVDPHEFIRPRKNAVSAEATGVWNPRRANRMPEVVPKSEAHK